jgi:peroxiredoxin
MRAWSSATLGGNPRQTIVRAVLAIVLVGVLVWALPERRAGENGGHHEHAATPPVVEDRFERAGVMEFREGQHGPAFRLTALGGRAQTLDDWHDKLVVLNFWATWCEPCTIEMPELEALWTRYRDRGLVVVGISVDRGAPRPLIDPYVQKQRLSFPILLDPDLATAGQWRVTAVPATFLVKPGGDVVGLAIGPREWTSAPMAALIETLLPVTRK